MARPKKSKYEQQKFSSYIDDWYSGKCNFLNNGDVVKLKNNPSQIGVIGCACHDIGYYDIKMYVGPNPWDCYWTTIHYSKVEKTDLKNPTKYSSVDRYPGPSNDAIISLNKKFDSMYSAKPKSGYEIDRELAIYEDEKQKNKLLFAAEHKETVVTEEDEIEESITLNKHIDAKEEKLLKIINEE
jgi:hypothetical protein